MSTTTKIDPTQLRVQDACYPLGFRLCYDGDPVKYLQAHIRLLRRQDPEDSRLVKLEALLGEIQEA